MRSTTATSIYCDKINPRECESADGHGTMQHRRRISGELWISVDELNKPPTEPHPANIQCNYSTRYDLKIPRSFFRGLDATPIHAELVKHEELLPPNIYEVTLWIDSARRFTLPDVIPATDILPSLVA